MPKGRTADRLPPGQDLEPRPDVDLPEKFAHLTEPERGILLAIVADRYATVPLAPVVARYGAETVEQLEALGLVERWRLRNGDRLTLTVWGAVGLELAEHPVWVTEEERDERGRLVRRQAVSEEPCWVHAGTAWGPPCPGKRGRRGVAVVRERTPRGIIQGIKNPEALVDRQPGPDWMIDPEAERVLRLFAGGRKPSAADESVLTSARSEPGRKDLAGGLGSVAGDPAPELVGVPIRIDPKLTRGAQARKSKGKGGRKRGPRRRSAG
jgi:hypothetical protein